MINFDHFQLIKAVGFLLITFLGLIAFGATYLKTKSLSLLPLSLISACWSFVAWNDAKENPSKMISLSDTSVWLTALSFVAFFAAIFFSVSDSGKASRNEQ